MTEIDPKLSELQAIQAEFDKENDDNSSRFGEPVLHAGFHLLNAANKVMRAFEQADS